MGGYELIWIVLFAPLLGSIVQALFGGAIVKKLGPEKGKRLAGLLAVAPILMAFLTGAVITFQLTEAPTSSRENIQTLFQWIDLQSVRIPFEARIDTLSMTMVLVITGIGTLIHLYATGYMAEEKEYTRFFTYLNLFVAAMLMLVLGNNLVLMFIGWEGVGVCSYLLIGFWYKDVENAKAANKAFIVNRIGDWGLTLGMFMLVAFMLVNYPELARSSDPRWFSYDVFSTRVLPILANDPVMATTIALLFFVGAMGKSAQFPLYIWLPDAMAGPTPVSALIHAATMVTSGVFLLNRVHGIFEASPAAMTVVAIIGAFTALFAAAIAFGQTDIKKVLAYSTVSQLGFMFVACGVGAFWVGMFHVITHAFFKALLFLGSGAVIHAMVHEQDMRRYGGLFKYIKITAITMIIGWFAIAGIPGLAGFWSKEAILGAAFGNHVAHWGPVNVSEIVGWVLVGVAVMTAAYMTRMTMLTFFGGKEQWRMLPAEGVHEGHDAHHDHGHDDHHAKGHAHGEHHGEDVHKFFYTDEEVAQRHASDHDDHHHDLTSDHQPHEVPISMWLPLVVLAILSIIGGYALYANHFLEHWLYPDGLFLLNKKAVSGHPHGWLETWLMPIGIGAGVLGCLVGWALYRKGLPKSERDEADWHPFRRAAGAQFGYDETMVKAGVEGGDLIANWTWKSIDVGVVDRIVNGLAWVSGGLGKVLKVMQTGYARTYALFMLLGGAALLTYFAYLLTQVGGRNG